MIIKIIPLVNSNKPNNDFFVKRSFKKTNENSIVNNIASFPIALTARGDEFSMFNE